MSVEQGVLGSAFVPATSLTDAVASASRDGGVVWIGMTEATLTELEEVGRTLGLDERMLARVLGWVLDADGGARMQGQLEILALPGAVAVLGQGLPEAVTPPHCSPL